MSDFDGNKNDIRKKSIIRKNNIGRAIVRFLIGAIIIAALVFVVYKVLLKPDTPKNDATTGSQNAELPEGAQYTDDSQKLPIGSDDQTDINDPTGSGGTDVSTDPTGTEDPSDPFGSTGTPTDPFDTGSTGDPTDTGDNGEGGEGDFGTAVSVPTPTPTSVPTPTPEPTPTPIPRTLYADRITKKDVTGAKWLTDKSNRTENGVKDFDVLPSENGGDVICITGWSFGTYYNAGRGWDGKNNTTYLTVTNSKGGMAFYPVKIEPGITGVTHEIKGGKNMDRADFTCVIDVTNFPDGTYSLGTCNYFTITHNGTTSKFHHGYTLGESYEIVVNSGKVTAVGGIENN